MSDSISARVIGTVGRTGQAKNGPYAVVEVKRDGSQYPDRVTVWGLDASTGDRVTVTGFLSWRKDEKDGKTYVNVSLNSPKVEKHDKAGALNVNDQTPF